MLRNKSTTIKVLRQETIKTEGFKLLLDAFQLVGINDDGDDDNNIAIIIIIIITSRNKSCT